MNQTIIDLSFQIALLVQELEKEQQKNQQLMNELEMERQKNQRLIQNENKDSADK